MPKIGRNFPHPKTRIAHFLPNLFKSHISNFEAGTIQYSTIKQLLTDLNIKFHRFITLENAPFFVKSWHTFKVRNLFKFMIFVQSKNWEWPRIFDKSIKSVSNYFLQRIKRFWSVSWHLVKVFRYFYSSKMTIEYLNMLAISEYKDSSVWSKHASYIQRKLNRWYPILISLRISTATHHNTCFKC